MNPKMRRLFLRQTCTAVPHPRPLLAPSRQSFTTTAFTTSKRQSSLPASYYRGGTSRAIMFRTPDLPTDKSLWPDVFRSALGSPDPNGRQLDGMGGGFSSLSKICIVGPSDHPEAEVDYTFAAVGVKDSEVDFSSNCGNMTAAVGPFAVDSGLLSREDGEASVVIRNTNTGKLIRAGFEVVDGEAVASGDFAIDGVAGTGARIELGFLRPAGSKTGKTLPTGKRTDRFDGVSASCVDVGNPCVFVSAEEMGVSGSILADAIEAHPDLLKRLDLIRRKAAVAMGLVKTENETSGSIPKIAMVSKPHQHRIMSGEELDHTSCDLVVRAISVGQPHRACPITVALALAVASRIEGSVVNLCTIEDRVDAAGITLAHNSGKLLVGAKFDDTGIVEEATVFRTARRLMDGRVYWK